MMQSRSELTDIALTEWGDLLRRAADRVATSANALARDAERTRLYAELTGWMAHRDPIALAEFVASQTARFDFLDAQPDEDDEDDHAVLTPETTP